MRGSWAASVGMERRRGRQGVSGESGWRGLRWWVGGAQSGTRMGAFCRVSREPASRRICVALFLRFKRHQRAEYAGTREWRGFTATADRRPGHARPARPQPAARRRAPPTAVSIPHHTNLGVLLRPPTHAVWQPTTAHPANRTTTMMPGSTPKRSALAGTPTVLPFPNRA